MTETIAISLDHVKEMHVMIEFQQKTIDLDRRIKEELECVVDLQKQMIEQADKTTAEYRRISNEAFRIANQFEEILRQNGITV